MAKRARVDPEFARYALSGIEAAIEKMQRQAAELRNIVGASAAGVIAAVGGARRGRPVGATSRAAKAGDNLASPRRNDQSNAPTVDLGATPSRKRTMSPEARRRISEAQKARWAKQKNEGGAQARKRGRDRAQLSGARRRKKR